MFNLDMALQLKRSTSQEAVLTVLQAGLKYSGGGWSTGKASKALFAVSGVGIVKATWETYRDIWLLAVAMICDVELPQMEMSQESSGAAFAIAAYAEELCSGNKPGEESSEDDDDLKFDWDEEEIPLPKELLQLWQRAEKGEHRIDVRRLLSEHAKLAGVPARAPENNLQQWAKTRHDKFLKVVSQSLLNIVRVLGNSYARPTQKTPQVNLQIWQHLCELYQRIQEERKDASVPGSSRSNQDNLWTPEDVKQQKMETSLQQISMGVINSRPFGHSFRSGPSRGFVYRGAYKGRSAGYTSYQGYSQARMPFKGKGRGVPMGKGVWKGRSWSKGGMFAFAPNLLGHDGITSDSGHDGTVHNAFSKAPLPWFERKNVLVDKVCSFTCPGGFAKRGGIKFSSPPVRGVIDQKIKRGRDDGFKSARGVHFGGGSKTGGKRGYKIFGALVCNKENGRKWQRKVETNFGLSKNKSLSKTPALQIGPVERYFPSFEKRNVGCKNRPEKRILSFRARTGYKTVCKDGNCREHFSDGRGLFWAKYSSLLVDAGYARFSKKMAPGGNTSVCVLGRHFNCFKVKRKVGSTNKSCASGFRRQRDVGEFPKIYHNTKQSGTTPRFSDKPGKRMFTGAPSKIKKRKERIGKICDSFKNDLSKGSSNFRTSEKFFDSTPLSPSFHGPFGRILQCKSPFWLGSTARNPRGSGEASARHFFSNEIMGRKVLRRSNLCKAYLFGFFNSGLGSLRCNFWKQNSGVLAFRKRPSHKCKRVKSSSGRSKKFELTRGSCLAFSRQSSCLFIPQKVWGKDSKLQRDYETIFDLVQRKENKFENKLGPFEGNVGRQFKQVVLRQRGLHPKQATFQPGSKNLSKSGVHTDSRHVCKSRECTVTSICKSLASSPGDRGKCFRSQNDKEIFKGLCKPPLDNNCKMAAQTFGKSRDNVLNNSSLLGWNLVVAPINTITSEEISSNFGGPQVGNVLQLPGRGDASYEMAPTFGPGNPPGALRSSAVVPAAPYLPPGTPATPGFDRM